ncbi:EAL domain-containing protein [Spirulina subsalsa]|uniref:EAL domain-containing protein n=1 Tax=Spirulina subsalsa TaxID=54311 RepID=UPI0002E58654|nr:EAL domain-containing protein [Spirulina subsalsa]
MVNQFPCVYPWLGLIILTVLGLISYGLNRIKSCRTLEAIHQYYKHQLTEYNEHKQTIEEQLTQKIERYQAQIKILQEQNDYYQLQYHHLPLPTYTFRRQSKAFVLVEWNEAASHFPYFYRTEEVGLEARELFAETPVIYQTLLHCANNHLPIQREITIGESQEIRQQLRLYWVWMDGDFIMLHIENITQQKQTEQELNIRLRQQSAVTRLGQFGLATSNLSALMDQAVRLVALTLEVKYCKILELLPNNNALLLRAGVGWKEEMVGYATVSASPNSEAGYTLLQHEPVVFQDLALETRFRGSPLLHNHKIVSGVSIIIPNREKAYGILGAYSHQGRQFTEDDIRFLQLVSHILATAIERHQQQAQLDLMKRAIDASSNGITIRDAIASNCPIIYVNPSFETLTGYRAEEVIGNPDFVLNGTETDPDVQRQLEEARVYGEEYHAVLEQYRQDGSLFWNELYIAPVHDSEGNLTHFIEVQTDITERKQFEEQLRNERDLLNGIMQTSVAAITVVNAQGQITFANQQAQAILGLTFSDEQTWTYDDQRWHIVDFEAEPFPLEQLPFNQVMKTGKPVFNVRHAIQFSGGPLKYLSINGSPLKDEQGQILAIVFSVNDITQQYQAEQEVREREEQFRLTFELAPIGMFISSLDGHLLKVNHALCEVLQYKPSQLLLKNLIELTHPDDQAADAAINQRLLLNEVNHYQLEKRYIAQDESIVHALVKVVVVGDGQGIPRYMIGQVVDISDRNRAEEALKESEQRLEGILSSIDDVVWSADARTLHLLYLNAATETVYGRSVQDFLDNPALWLDTIHPDDRSHLIDQFKSLFRLGTTKSEFRIVQPNGTIRWLASRCRVVRDIKGQPLRLDGICSDITERRQAEEQLRHNAFYDSLTDLPNRVLFLDRLWHTIRRAKRRGGYLFAVLFLDLDSFKVINDSLGHTIGDQLLIALARRLESCLRASDTLARLGGDEFTLLLEDIGDRQDAIAVAEKILEQIKSPFILGGYEVFTNASIGIAFSHITYENIPLTCSIAAPDYDTPEDLLRDADTAMYRAKAHGKGRYTVFDQNMHQRVLARLTLETDLRRAIERQEFLAYYQPIISLSSGEIVGFETLMRWHPPGQNFVSPAEFIPVAEETGLILPMGQWIFREAAAQLRQWQNKFPQCPPLTMNINLSGKQIRERDLLDYIDQTLEQLQLDGNCLKLEITESVLMENADSVDEVILALRARNLQLCIDDFGTGYSSLSYLHRFPVSTLKIDRSFVMRMQPNGTNLEIIQAVITLAHTLGINVVAEGIETEIQLRQLQNLGCDYGQGYYFCRPLDAQSAEEFLAQTCLGQKRFVPLS